MKKKSLPVKNSEKNTPSIEAGDKDSYKSKAPSIIGTDDKLGIQKRLLEIKNIDAKKNKNLRVNDRICEGIYNGYQWDNNTGDADGMPPINDMAVYDSSGKEIWVWKDYKYLPSDKFPRRVINMTQTLVEQKTAIYMLLDPSVRVAPVTNKNEKYQKQARKLNKFFAELFNPVARMEEYCTFKDILIDGYGFMMIHTKEFENHEIPFYLTRETPQSIVADNSANKWRKTKYVIRTIKKYGYELKEKYKNKTDWEDLKDYSIEEYYVYNDHTGKWRRYFMYDSKLLIKTTPKDMEGIEDYDYYSDATNEFDELPIQGLIIQPALSGWRGISMVFNIADMQLMLNKDASREDFSKQYQITPTLLIDITAKKELEDSDVLKPDKVIAVNMVTGVPDPVRPVTIPGAAPGMWEESRNRTLQDMRNITGITPELGGNSSTGTYSAKFAETKIEQANIRIKGEEVYLGNGISEVARKVCAFAKAHLDDTGSYYEIYDPEEDEIIKLTAEDFDLTRMNIDIEMIEANLYSPSELLNKMNAIKQYAPNFDDKQIVISMNNLIPGWLDKDYVAMIEKQAKMDYKKVNDQYEQMMNPKPVETPPANPPTPTPSPATNPQPSQTSAPQEAPATLEQFVQPYIDRIVEQGVPLEQAQKAIGTLIKKIGDSNPNLTDEEFKVQFENEIKNI